jgi:prolyl oligopeptidase
MEFHMCTKTLQANHVVLVMAAASIAALLASVAHAKGQPAAPQARVAPVEDEYFGTRVVDPYRWMETPGDAELLDWLKQQDHHTRAVLDSIEAKKQMQARIHELNQATSEVYALARAGNRVFYFRQDPAKPVPTVMVRDGLTGAERLLLDPASLSGAGAHAEAGWFEASKDGRFLAVGISFGGAEEAGHLRVIDVDQAQLLDEDLPRVWSGEGGGAAWLPDNRSFTYMQYPPGQSAQERLFRARSRLHTLGRNATGDRDPAIFGFEVDPTIAIPKENWNFVSVPPGSEYAIAVTATVDVDLPGVFVAPLSELARSKVHWTQIARSEDRIQSNPNMAIHGRDLYVVSRKDAPRFRVLRVDLTHPDLKRAEVVVPESDIPIEDISAAADGLYVLDLNGGPSRLRRLRWGEKEARPVALPFTGAIRNLATHPGSTGALLRMRSWTRSNAILFVDADGKVTDTGWQEPAKADFSGIDEREVMVVSYDGTQVPLSILIRKDAALDGSHAALLESYGAYGVYGTAKPRFDPMRLAWLERGGVIAIAHPRGGGEFGEEWHLGGKKETKLNTVFDTIACAQYLADMRYTAPAKLALYGASAGGIVAGGGLTWRPDLFAAVISHAGVSDALRFEASANGPANVPEFGSTKTESGFHGLYAMSAYHHVRDGVSYPAVLLEAGVNDPRVDAWQMAKMAARLQAASASTRPVLLRVDFDTGHFGGTTEQTEQLLADEWSFLLWQFGVASFRPAD